MGLTGNLYLGMKYERQLAPSDSFTVTGQLTGFARGGIASSTSWPSEKNLMGGEGAGGVFTAGQLITTNVKSGPSLLLTNRGTGDSDAHQADVPLANNRGFTNWRRRP